MLVYERRGSGPPLVLIHGIGSRWQAWEPVLDEVSRHREVIALDLPGFGASPIWPARTADAGITEHAQTGSVGHLADQVADFLHALGLDRPHLAGNSLGGGIALELGRRGLAQSVTAFAPVGFWGRPGLHWCRAVVGGARVAGTALRPALPGIFATRAGRAALCSVFYARTSRLSPADCLASARALSGATGFAAARAAFGDWPAAGADPGSLRTIAVTIAWGTRDVVLPYRSQAGRARAWLPTARHVLLPGCGHLPFPDDPQRCAGLLTDCQ